MNAFREVHPRSILAVLALRSVPAEAPLPGWVNISITLSLKMTSGIRESRCEKIAHAHQLVACEGPPCVTVVVASIPL